MTNNALLALFDRQQRVEIEYPGARKEVIGAPGEASHLVRFVRPAPGMSFILYSRVDAARLDDEIEAQLADFRALDQPFEWMVYQHDQPPELAERLRARGFTCDQPNPILYLDLQAAPPALTQAAPHPGLRAITRREELGDVIQVMETVYGGSFAWMWQRLGDHLEIPGYLSIYVLDEGSQPACAAWTYFSPNSLFAGLWGGSTIPAARGRGLYTASLAARVQEAIRRGRRYLYLDASSMSEPIVRRYGFRQLVTFCAYEPPDSF